MRRIRANAIAGAAAVLLASASPAAASPGPPSATSAWIAHIVIATPARAAPGDASVEETIPATASVDGGGVALLVEGARVVRHVRWLRVLLPQRPNGATAWINANYIRLARTTWRIDVSLEDRTVTLLRRGRLVERWRAVVGKPSTPTPRGLYAVYQEVRQPDPNAFLGSWALLLTAFSPALREFDGGPGQVAIHGRGGASLLDPLGSARSHGCIRIDNSAIDVLARRVGDGTPVSIS